MTSPVHARGGQDRWLLSYADLVTLLLAFFTTIYAASPAARTSLDAMAVTPAGAGPTTARTATPATRALDALQDRLTREVAADVRLARAEISRDTRGLVVSLPERATFPAGQAEMSADTRALLARVAEPLLDVPNGVRIEGHTDDVPMAGDRYRSNWELSTARASGVVAFLIEQAGIAPGRLSAAGYGEFHPRVPNDSVEHRARNRRIDIVVLESAPAGPETAR